VIPRFRGLSRANLQTGLGAANAAAAMTGQGLNIAPASLKDGVALRGRSPLQARANASPPAGSPAESM
jgi:hypothetical protein